MRTHENLSTIEDQRKRSLSNKRNAFRPDHGPAEENKDETEIDWLSMKPKKPTSSGIQWMSQQQPLVK